MVRYGNVSNMTTGNIFKPVEKSNLHCFLNSVDYLTKAYPTLQIKFSLLCALLLYCNATLSKLLIFITFEHFDVLTYFKPLFLMVIV